MSGETFQQCYMANTRNFCISNRKKNPTYFSIEFSLEKKNCNQIHVMCVCLLKNYHLS